MVQQRLFPDINRFSESMPEGFFSAIPRLPGVYFYYSKDGDLLYVGKAKDLRARISSYRYLPPRGSRKLRRLVNLIHYVAWELMENEEAALLRENHLIADRKPPFNRANKAPEHYHFLHLIREGSHIRLWLSKDIEPLAMHSFGAFKSKLRIQEIVRAWMNIVLFLDHRYQNKEYRVASDRYRRCLQFNYSIVNESYFQNFVDFFSGRDCDLLEEAFRAIEEKAMDCGLSEFRLRQDIELCQQEFTKIFQRQRSLIEKFGNTSLDWIPKEKLNEYLLKNHS